MNNPWQPNRPVWLWRESGREYFRGLPDEWALNGERYEGAWICDEACEQEDDANVDALLASMLVIRAVANCVRRGTRAEDLWEDVVATKEYVDELCLTPSERASMTQALDALHPLDPARLSDQLLAAGTVMLDRQLRVTARVFFELAYDTARHFRCDDCAAAACTAISRLAILEEAKRSARLWQGRAGVYQRRVVRGRAGDILEG